MPVDLSAQYLIHIVYSTQPTDDPTLQHENICSGYGFTENPNPSPSGWIDGADLMVAEGFLIPEMRFCPYFGREHAGDPPVYGTGHGAVDLDNIAAQAGLITINPPGSPTPWSVVNPRTQKAVDNYEYDPRYIPLEARKNARYGAEEIEYVTPNDPAILEACIFYGYEVDLGINLGNLDWGYGIAPGTYTNGQPVQTINGVPVAIYPDPVQVWQTDPNTNLPIGPHQVGVHQRWEWLNGAWQLVEDGHSMLAVAWDRQSQLFLLKNSWGTDTPYVWVPYQYIRERCFKAKIITKIRFHIDAPSYETIWLGHWKMDHDGWLGDLIIRHTRARGQSAGTVTRLGTYYDGQGVGHTVTGYIEYDPLLPPDSIWSGRSRAHLWIDFDNPEGPPDPLGQEIVCKGQEFNVLLYGIRSRFYGDYAVGWTMWNEQEYGVLLARPGKQLDYVSGEFNIERWDGLFAIFPINPVVEVDVLAFYHVPPVWEIAVQEPPYDYYRVMINGKYLGTISKNNTHRLQLWNLIDTLRYHTREVGLATGASLIATQNFYVGNTKTKELHVPSCIWGGMIHSKVYFLTLSDAFQKGYNGCYYCLHLYDTR